MPDIKLEMAGAPETAAAEAGVTEAEAAAQAAAEAKVTAEMTTKLESLRARKKYLEEIKELEAQVRDLQDSTEAPPADGDISTM